MNSMLRRLAEWGADPEEAIACRMMDDIELYDRLLKKMSSSGDRFEHLYSAVERKDYEAAYYEAHQLKGTAGVLSLKPLFICLTAVVNDLDKKKYEFLEEDLAKCKEVFEEFKALAPERAFKPAAR